MIRRSAKNDGITRDHRKFNAEISRHDQSSAALATAAPSGEAGSVMSVFPILSVKSPRKKRLSKILIQPTR